MTNVSYRRGLRRCPRSTEIKIQAEEGANGEGTTKETNRRYRKTGESHESVTLQHSKVVLHTKWKQESILSIIS